MKRMSAVIAADRRRFVTPEPLNVAPALVGLPLAAPTRRALAMGLDLIVVALLSGVSGFWLAGGLVLVALQLRSGRGGGTGPRQIVGWLLVALLAALAVKEAWTAWQAPPATPAAAEAAPDTAEDDERADTSALKHAGLSDGERIALLEHALAEARKPRKLTLHDGIDELTRAVGASFGWGIVYFSLLPALWQGQTIGKKVLGLRVVELTGKPMTVMRCLKRYGGYAAGMATGGLGFSQLFWDDNRQAIQDRAAHTVVIDLQSPPRPAD
jgi:uncharacterized RDD family membrane protein YckC